MRARASVLACVDGAGRTTLPRLQSQAPLLLRRTPGAVHLVGGAGGPLGGDDLRQRDPKFLPPRFAQYLAAVDQLGTLARERFGRSVLALALRWVLDQGTVALWGVRNPGQLDGIDEALGWKLDADAMATLGLV